MSRTGEICELTVHAFRDDCASHPHLACGALEDCLHGHETLILGRYLDLRTMHLSTSLCSCASLEDLGIDGAAFAFANSFSAFSLILIASSCICSALVVCAESSSHPLQGCFTS
jgi:hypothetical protein